MKRYFFGIVAVVFAIVLVSFTTHKPVDDMFVFQYDPTASGGYAVADVENISNANWKYQGKNLSLCSNDDYKACRVAVRGDYVNSTTTPTALQSVTIDATLSGTTAHVESITGTASQYSNQPE